MATITRSTQIAADPDEIWDAVRDFGGLHLRVAPGLVVSTTVELAGPFPVRLVTFASGLTLCERIVAVDDAARRLVWSIDSADVVHHNGALQVDSREPGQTRVTWTADVLPDALAEAFAPLMDAGLAAMRALHEGEAAPVRS